VRGVPPDYYRRLHAVEDSHWWQLGMRAITASMLGAQLQRRHLRLLDAGCGTGGFLAWAALQPAFERLCGADVSSEAIELAQETVPSAELHVAPLRALPFEDAAFDVVVLNDVLQHVDEDELESSLREVRRVLDRNGVVLARTNAGRRARRDRRDWRLYDAAMLRRELEGAGFRVERLTHANALLGAWGSLRGRAPVAPTATSCGIPDRAGRLASAVGLRVLELEARYLRGPRRSLRYGHTLLALANRAAER